MILNRETVSWIDLEKVIRGVIRPHAHSAVGQGFNVWNAVQGDLSYGAIGLRIVELDIGFLR